MLNMLSSDTTRDFLIEHVNEMSDFDKSGYAHVKEAVLTEKVINFPGICESASCQDIIKRSLGDLTKMIETGNIPDLINFYSYIKDSSPIGDAGIVITVPNQNEIDKIRPQFLIAYAESVRNNIMLYIKKSIDKDRLKGLSAESIVATIKRQICKSMISTSYDITDIAKSMNGMNVTLDSAYIFNQIVPFLKNLAVDYKNLSRECALTINAIVTASNSISDTIKAYNDMNLDHSVDKDLSVYMYKAMRYFVTLRSYTAFIMTRKILIFTHTLLAYSNLYNVLLERFPEGARILHESVLDGNLSRDVEDIDLYNDMINGEGNLMCTKIRSAVDMRSTDIANYSNKTIGYNILNVVDGSSNKYNRDDYQNIVEIFNSFNSRINDFVNSIMAGEIFDDAQAHTGFDQSISIKYSTIINKFSEIDATDYTSNGGLPIDQMVSAYSELLDMETNIGYIQAAIKSSRAVIDDATRTFADAKLNQNEISVAVLNEASAFMTEMDRQFKDLVVQVCKSIHNRIINLDDSISVILNAKDNSDIVVTESDYDPYDTDTILNEMAVDEAIRAAERSFRECVMDYEKSRTYKYERVKVVFEADTAAADTSVGSSTPATSSTSTSGSGDDKTLGQRFADIGKAIAEFFRKLFSRVNADIAKIVGDNEKWFAENEQALRDADVSNLSLRIRPFDDSKLQAISTDLAAIKGRITSLNPNEIAKKKDYQIHYMIYGEIPFHEVDIMKQDKQVGFSEMVRAYYSVGTNKDDNRTPLTGDALKARIPIMIDFCKGGYKAAADKFESECKSAQTALDQKLGLIAKESVGSDHGVNLRDFIFEADTQAPTTTTAQPAASPAPAQSASKPQTNNNDNKNNGKPSVEVKPGATPKPNNGGKQKKGKGMAAAQSISKEFMTFTSAVLTSLRDRETAYMSALKQILKVANTVEKDAEKAEEQKNDNNENATDNNQQQTANK